MNTLKRRSAVGFGYRAAIDAWTRANFERFDLLEITVDHCIFGSDAQRCAIYDLVGSIPVTAHGVGLSIGTDAPLDLDYLDKVTATVERLKALTYSEHLAFTRVPGCDLGNLLPLPKLEAVAEAVIAKVLTIRERVPVPFLLENISEVFEWPDRDMTDAEFITLICRETGTGLLLDIENLYLNSINHGLDAREFIDSLPAGLVKEVHLAGGAAVNETMAGRRMMADSHSHPVPEEALALLDRTLLRHTPTAIVLERDERLDVADEILGDIARIRARLANWQQSHADTARTAFSTN
jgi:uncharacterized protein (UPF0276 family)